MKRVTKKRPSRKSKPATARAKPNSDLWTLDLMVEKWKPIDPPGAPPIHVVIFHERDGAGLNYIRTVAEIFTAPHRTEEEALRLAEQIKADVSALDTIRNEPGIIDHRKRMPKIPIYRSLAEAGKNLRGPLFHGAKGGAK